MINLSIGTAVRATQLLGLLFISAISPVNAQSFVQVAPGASHICALDAAGQIECTSTAIATRFLPPDDFPLLRDIAAGQQHTCGITLDNTVECFGTNTFGVLDVPNFDAPVESLSVGVNHSCAVDADNAVQCWGLNSNAQLDVPQIPGGFVKVDAGRSASCGIDTAGDIHCWTTDVNFFPGEVIPGPFVDLDIDFQQACGLTANGDIECFATNDILNFEIPSNGPYTDLTVTNSSICGLGVNQLLDCTFAAPTSFPFDTASDEFPLDVAFSSIESSNILFGGVPICGVVAEDGSIRCFGFSGNGFGGELPPPPGADLVVNPLNASNITLALTAEVYGQNQVELFWNRLPSVFPPIFVEVFRDDELIETTSNGFSFLDFDTVNAEQSNYRIRAVDEAGNVGEFSNSIVVDRVALDVELLDNSQTVDNPRPESLVSIQEIAVTAFITFLTNNDSFILEWNVENSSNVDIAGFEVRIDNSPVAFVNNTTFIGDGVVQNVCRIYSVAAIGNDGAVLDYAAVSFGTSNFTCQSVP